jgi:hypothetical protein
MANFKPLGVRAGVLAGLLMVPLAGIAQGQAPAAVPAAMTPTYSDLASLSDASPLVIRAQIRRQTALKPERAPGLAPGFARLYVEAQTVALIAGRTSVPASFAYLVDVPLDAKGKVPKLTKRDFVLFARPVQGRAGEVQLVSPAGQLAWSPELEARLRPILTELYAAEVPPKITGVTEALAVPGTLTGESETQIFLATANRSPVSITVLRRPGQRPQWGVSWGEIIDSAAMPPARDTLRWYRLACSLPDQLPSSANLSRDAAERRLAAADYAVVREGLGACERRITKQEPLR